MKVSRLIKKLRQAVASPSLLVDYIREPRQLVLGGELANRAGLQVARAALDEAAWRLRSRPIVSRALPRHVEELEREGVVVIPNFLPDAAFAEVHAEVLRAMPPGPPMWKRFDYGENFASDQVLVTHHREAFPKLCEHVQRSAIIGELAAATSRRAVTYDPHVMVQEICRIDGTKPHADLDYNQFSHADRHYPFIKAFLYLVDVDERTAPYCYARRSHRITAARLQHEYRYSVCHSKVRSRGYVRDADQLALDLELRELNDSYLARIGSSTEPLVGRANTLIVSNNQGFHRRAPLLGDKRRLMVVSDYKFLEARAARWLYPVLKHAYRQ